MLTDDEYSTTQQKLLLLCAFVRDLDLEGFLERIQTTHVVAPILDPTLYMRGAGKLDLVERLARAALALKREADEQVATAGAASA